MKKTIAALTLAAALLLAPAAFAEDNTFGVIDMTRVMKETDAAKGMLAEMEAKRKEYETQINKEGDALAKVRSDLSEKRSKMSEEEFDKANKDFEEKINKAQKMVQDRKEAFDKGLNDAVA